MGNEDGCMVLWKRRLVSKELLKQEGSESPENSG